MNWPTFEHGKIKLMNCDCTEYMKTVPDKYFDLAIVDPPYGIGEDGRNNHTRGNLAKASDYRGFTKYDCYKPSQDYFYELIRVSKNQIIWGANHFGFMPASPAWIVWDKENGDTDFADCELAYSSFEVACRKFKWRWSGMLQEDMKNKQKRIHPNEKPIALYKWILKNYSQEGDKIFDSHLGSASIALACHDYKFELTGCEIDKDYFDASVKRFKNHAAQLSLV